MNKKFAFSLVEILMTMVIIGILMTISISLTKSRDYIQRSYVAKAQKVIRTVDLAMAQIREINKDECPMGTFIYKVGDDYHFAILDGTERADSSDVITLFSEHIKFYESNFNFCDRTKYCADDSIKGASLTGNLNIGIRIFADSNIKPGNCPQYVVPDKNTKVTPASDTVCWGELLVDADGSDGPSKLGQDVYVFGLGATGIVR